MDFGSSELPISIYPCPIKAYVLRQTHKKKFSRAANLKFGFKQATGGLLYSDLSFILQVSPA